jgi:hypothetical protein
VQWAQLVNLHRLVTVEPEPHPQLLDRLPLTLEVVEAVHTTPLLPRVGLVLEDQVALLMTLGLSLQHQPQDQQTPEAAEVAAVLMLKTERLAGQELSLLDMQTLILRRLAQQEAQL